MMSSLQSEDRSFYLPQRQDLVYWLVAFLIFYIDQVSIWGYQLNQGPGSALLNVGIGVIVAYPHLYWFEQFYDKRMGIYFAGLVFLGLLDTSAYWWFANAWPLDINPSNRIGIPGIDWVGEQLIRLFKFFREGEGPTSKSHTIWVRNFPEALIVMWSLTVVHRRKTLDQDLGNKNRQLKKLKLNLKYKALQTQQLKLNLKNKVLQTKELELNLKNNRLSYDNLLRRMEPHFLMNRISTLHTQAQGNPDLQENITQIKEIMEYVLQHSQAHTFRVGVPLVDEVKFLNMLIPYHEAAALQHGLQPRVTFDISDTIESESVQVPPMVFAEFIENAFKYGVKQYGRHYLASLKQAVPLPAPFVHIQLFSTPSQTRFLIQNQIPEPGEPARSTGEGLPNIRQRLHLFYGDRFTDNDLQIDTTNGIFQVTLTLNS